MSVRIGGAGGARGMRARAPAVHAGALAARAGWVFGVSLMREMVTDVVHASVHSGWARGWGARGSAHAGPQMCALRGLHRCRWPGMERRLRPLAGYLARGLGID